MRHLIIYLAKKGLLLFVIVEDRACYFLVSLIQLYLASNYNKLLLAHLKIQPKLRYTLLKTVELDEMGR